MMNGSRKSFPYHENTILVWKYRIVEKPAFSFWGILSQDEKKRGLAFVYDKDRIRYLFCRGVLRIVLSEFTGIEPRLIPFRYTQTGKPYLCCEEKGLLPFKFNLSHTEDAVIIALSSDTELGIDLEIIRPIRETSAIVRNYFSFSEQEYMKRYSGHGETNAFFHCWTRKEAFFKGLGSGIVSEKIGSISCLEQHLNIATNSSSEELWTIETLPICSRYSAAIAYRGKDHKLVLSENEWPAS